MADDNLIPAVIIDNASASIGTLVGEFVRVLLDNQETALLKNNQKYFETMCGHLSKETTKYKVVYQYMIENNKTFALANPFTIYDYLHLYSHTLIQMLNSADCVEKDQNITNITQDVLLMLTRVSNLESNDSRVANFCLISPMVH